MKRTIVLLALAVMAPGVARAGDRDPTTVLRPHYSPPLRLERRPAPGLGARVQRWAIISARGDTVFGLWRPAPAKVVRPWTAVLLGGFYTGDRAALLVPDDTLFNTLAVNWPWRGKRRLSKTEFALKLPAIERAVQRTPAVLALGVDAVAQARGVDASRIVLVGASLGVPPALAALRLTSAPAAVVLVDGGADLEMMIRAGLAREGWMSGPAALSAAGAMQWLWPLEPTLNAPAAARLPVLLMNSTGDERVPRASVLKLQASLPHATIRWRNGPHIRPSQKDVFARLTREVDAWLRAAEPGAPASRPSASLPDPH
jgi:pimeloyl-ACP methyl ester carboxylesterase